MAHHEFVPVLTGISEGRRTPLTEMIRSARAARKLAEPSPMSLAKIREALVSGVAVEDFQAARGQDRFFGWLERTCRKAVKHASDQSSSGPLFGNERMIMAGGK